MVQSLLTSLWPAHHTQHYSLRPWLRSAHQLILKSLARQLNITRHHSVIFITGIGGGKATQTRGVALLKLRSLHSRSDVIIQAHILQTLTNILPPFNAAPQEWPHLTKLALADPDFLTPRPVDIIIGADSYGQIIKPNIIKRDTLMPIAQLSIFGWFVLGPVDTSSSASAAVHHASIQERKDALDELLSKSGHKKKCLRATILILLLTRKDVKNISRFMTEYQELNHMKKASPVSSQHTQYYLPHHGVLRPDSATTTLRVVFDGSNASALQHLDIRCFALDSTTSTLSCH
ncbi:uncharacterized protein LOC112467526 [Temnothorax curvispinosus]|uniref:Uncharacterized protein LOC112467526 n=1 Tax=Temnothorax curvispinosus TaxID=300111 RepID=A0A6J1RB67_9HYME|nr:uncharacterized protein LOC112467526 [Temnothorax curvispinosus]